MTELWKKNVYTVGNGRAVFSTAGKQERSGDFSTGRCIYDNNIEGLNKSLLQNIYMFWENELLCFL